MTAALQVAHAQSVEPNTDTFQPSVSETQSYDDNIFRLPEGQTPGGATRSDLEFDTSVALRIDKHFSQQSITVDAALTHYDYTDHPDLNFTGKNVDATWGFAFTPELTGHLIYTRAQSLNSFADFTGLYSRNINTNSTKRIDADYRLLGAVHFDLAVDQFLQENDEVTYAFEDVRINSLEAGVRYESNAGNSLGLYGRSAQGTSLDGPLNTDEQVDTGFNERQIGVRVSAQLDGKSGLFGQIGELSRTYDHFSSRNFSGPVAQLKYTWQVTGKTEFDATLTRTLGAYQTLDSSYVATNILSLGPKWAITGKTTLNAQVSQTQYQFRGALFDDIALRSDNIRAETLSANWHALHDLNVILSYTHSNRSSNYPGLQFSDNTESLLARFSF